MSHQNRQPDTYQLLGKNDTVVPHIRPRDINRTPFGPVRTPGERSALTELDAMHVIGETLSEVSDEETRARVLAWAVKLFTDGHGAPDLVSREARTESATGTSNPPVDLEDALSLDSLETILTNDRAPRKKMPASRPRLRARPLLTVRFRWRT